MSSSTTRRMYRRVSAEYPSWYLSSTSCRTAVVRDLSLNGFRIEGPSDLPRNAMVTVRIWLPHQETSIDIDQAVVRWVRGREFGVQIVALSNESDLRLANHIARTLQHKPMHGLNTVTC